MPKKATQKPVSHHVMIGVTAIISAVLLLVGMVALLTYISYVRPHHSATRVASLHSPTDRSPLRQLLLAINAVQSTDDIKPDTQMPPMTDGMAPVVTSLKTDKPVVFLTIDDGAHKSPDELQSILDHHLHATLFLARLFVDDNPQFFKDFADAGNPIENHTLDHHTDMVEMSYEEQKAQICGMADYEEQQYGRRPTLFRPPGGAYNDVMRRAAADCGMKAVVTWIAKANGGSMQYQIGDHLRPGDIVLMHFRPEFQQDLHAFIDAMNEQKLHTELLEDWLQ